ncbi:hypothetical protein [Streptomyces sp. NPDC001652]|uniref:hypothetical protein n=1 Tax=Streptomyces sp. NPDC001652 TaxID=3154393 RepID=UPI00331C5F93
MNAENWIAVAATVAAVVAVIISVVQIRHARAQSSAALEQADRVHREQNEPYVIVDIQPDGPGSGLLVLLVENIGPTLARDVKITVDPPLASSAGDKFTERIQRDLARPIPMLPPHRRLKWAFDVSSQRFGSGLPTAFTFTVESKGPFGDVEPSRTWLTSRPGKEPCLASTPTRTLRRRWPASRPTSTRSPERTER